MSTEMISDMIKTCRVLKNNKKETLEDKGAESDSKCLIDNTANQVSYNLIEFEDCVFKRIQSQQKKCDFGVETDNDIFYIELKGSDNNQGLKQLLATVESTKDYFKIVKEKKKPVQKKMTGILVVSKKEVPRDLDKITLRKLSTLLGAAPIIEKNSYTIKIS